MPATRVRELLDQQRIKYVTIRHSPAFTASEVAALAHVASNDFAKTVVVTADGRMSMIVIPASRRIQVHHLCNELGADVRLATETELAAAFPDCEVGAMPPIGKLYGLPVYVSSELAREKEIAFNAGTHTEVIKMAYADFAAIARPSELPSITTL